MVTSQQLEQFIDFARNQIVRGNAESMEQILHDWECERQHIELLREGIEQAESGQGLPVDDAFAEIKQDFQRSVH